MSASKLKIISADALLRSYPNSAAHVADILEAHNFPKLELDLEVRFDFHYQTHMRERVPPSDISRRHLGRNHQLIIFERLPEYGR
jgi:hypothetical protein